MDALPTLADLCAAFARDTLADQAPRTQYLYHCFFGQLLRDLGNVPLQDLTPELLRAWKLRLSARYKPATVRRYMSRLGVMLRAAVEEYQWLSTNPLQRLKRPTPGRGVVRFLSSQERGALLAACRQSANPALYPIVILALSTGGRKNELRCLRWGQVDLERATVSLYQTKASRSLTLPLVGEALTLLQTWQQEGNASVPWVFPNDTGSGPRPIESAWLTALKQSGVSCFRFHDLRHSCASYLAMSGASLLEIAAILGHSSITTTTIYTHLTDNHLRGVIERMHRTFLSPPEAP